ncbi:hypothetical protein ABG768_004670, partial [Culter alburnus]
EKKTYRILLFGYKQEKEGEDTGESSGKPAWQFGARPDSVPDATPPGKVTEVEQLWKNKGGKLGR